MIRLVDIVDAEALPDYRLRLRFEDGVEGIVDVSALVTFDGVFAALADPHEFSQVFVDPELGTVGWPGGADLDPAVLYSQVHGDAHPSQDD
jgi:hypothetical protein